MSSKKYQAAFRKMTDRQHMIMWDLFEKSVNHDGHAWNTFGDIENAVADLIDDVDVNRNIKVAEVQIIADQTLERYRNSIPRKAFEKAIAEIIDVMGGASNE